MERAKLPAAMASAASPFDSSNFVTSGSVLLDLALGGGWGKGRVVNLVGDRSSGKTLLAIEACANFAKISGDGAIRYVEAEAAFDEEYGKVLGMPEGVQLETGIRTVEDLHADLIDFLAKHRDGQPCIYVVDSLDSLSDSAEMDRPIGEGSYNVAKAKLLSEMFRQRISDIHASNCTLMVVSQTRDKIGVVFGEKKTRSGGRALDFYASQIVWLSEVGKIKRTVKGAQRTIGLDVLAKLKKNKMGMPFREAELTIIFGYGVDDEETMLNWISKNKAEKLLGDANIKELRALLGTSRQNHDRDALEGLSRTLREATRAHWMDIEQALEPPMRKY